MIYHVNTHKKRWGRRKEEAGITILVSDIVDKEIKMGISF